MTTTTIRGVFDHLVPVARRGLRDMMCDDGAAFGFTARQDAHRRLVVEGRSERYGAMALIGIAHQATLGHSTDVPTSRVADHLHGWATRAPIVGDAGLVLWSELARDDPRAEDTVRALLDRCDAVFAPGYDVPSMETALLLLGLAHAMRAAVGGARVATLAADVAARLQQNQHPTTDLFSFGRKVRRKNLHRARMDYRLGSFASQVYPTMAFAAFAEASGDDRARGVATRCATRLCELQGEHGQWWWIYHTNRAQPALRYPVYAVHQDAMGPMALLAAARADGGNDRYDAALLRSLTWFDDHPECPGVQLIDPRLGVVWRAVQHDEPGSTGRLGLGRGELARMGRAAWFGSADARPLERGFVCLECRPYHLGWILLAAAMYEGRHE